MSFRNEAEVQHYFVSRLLEILGYDVPEEAPAEDQLEFRIAAAGRARIPLKRPDFLVRSLGRALLVIETKAPGETFSVADIEQALSYARHEEVRAPLTMLANGRRITVLESDTRHKLLDIPHDQLCERYRDLHLLLSKETLGSTVDGHIRLNREVGRGAFGVVYEASNMRVKRREAVKIYTFHGEDRERKRRRFRQGAIAHARLEHPNIATFYGTVEYGGELAVRMRFVDGVPLHEWIKKSRPSIRERVLLLAQVAETIAFAHAHDVLHRDLKPSNIMVVEDGDGVRPIIVDFDTAVVVGESTMTHTAERFGTFGYLDPEMLEVRWRTELRDPRSDVYSLGRLLEFVLTNEDPRPGRPMRDVDERIRKATRGLTSREQNLLIEVLVAAIAERRDDRTETAAALGSDLRTIFESSVGGELNPKEYAEEVFRQFDLLVAEERLPMHWQNLTSMIRPDEFGRYSPLPAFGELNALYDEGFYSFYVGLVIGDEREFTRFRASKQLRALRRAFGKDLRVDPITNQEDGAASVILRFGEVRKQSPRETALRIADILRRFLTILHPPERAATRLSAQPRPADILSEMESWPARSFRSRQAFKKLTKEIRECQQGRLSEALLPFLRLLWPSVRLTPDLRGDGVDVGVGEPLTVAIACSGNDVDSVREAVESFRRSSYAVRDFIVVINREEQTVAFRESLRLSLDRLVAEGKAQRAVVWNHRDHVVYAAFEAILQRVTRALERWNTAVLAEQEQVERTIGASPLRRVPFREYRMRIDAAALWPGGATTQRTGDVVEALVDRDQRLIHVVLGSAGCGKTTSVMRAARERALQWLIVPAARIVPGGANAHSVFETAVDMDEVLAGAAEDEREIWARIVGPVLKYLTQFRSGIGIIVDALDESPALGRSYGLHTFFNFLRRAVVPIIVTMRNDFWLYRRSDFVPGKSERESTVQTLDVIELMPWTDEQIVEAATLRLADVRNVDVRERIATFIREVRNGRHRDLYGDITNNPLYLRFILDLLDRRDPRNVPRRELIRLWIEQKIERDVQVPVKKGGSRIAIRTGVATASETIPIAMRAMTEAACCMTETRDGAIELLPDCEFAAIRDAMGAAAPDSAESLVLNSVLVAASGRSGRLRFAHRIFQEFFLAEAALRFEGLRLPKTVADLRETH